MSTIFERAHQEMLDYFNRSFTSKKYIVESGDHVSIATDSKEVAIKEASDQAHYMTATVYVNTVDRGFTQFATFHYVAPYSVDDAKVVTLLMAK